MSAVLTRRRRSGRGRERDQRQPSLFSQVVAPPPLPEAPAETQTSAAVFDVPVLDPPAPSSEPAERHESAPHEQGMATAQTLDEAISALWGDLTSGDASDCPVCGSAMQPRHSAGAGIVGGRCSSCATTLA